MSPAATKLIIKPPPITVNHHPKSKVFLCKTRFSCPSFCTLEESANFHRKSVGFMKTIASVSMETRLVNGSGGDDRCINPKTSAFEHEALVSNGGLHTLFNRLSKWVVAVAFGGFIILRHDDLASWAATGCISNVILSITLLRILKQDRPVSEVSSAPGMPSSHAQTLFFTLVFVIMSVIKSMEMNGVVMIIGILLVALGSYFSWLRVLLGYHTTSQVIAGIVVGSNFAILWFWAWEATVSKACSSNLWVQTLLSAGGGGGGMGLPCGFSKSSNLGGSGKGLFGGYSIVKYC
ncbi:hypothetical protein R6Q57_011773 [Mikania cordata]